MSIGVANTDENQFTRADHFDEATTKEAIYHYYIITIMKPYIQKLYQTRIDQNVTFRNIKKKQRIRLACDFASSSKVNRSSS